MKKKKKILSLWASYFSRLAVAFHSAVASFTETATDRNKHIWYLK